MNFVSIHKYCNITVGTKLKLKKHHACPNFQASSIAYKLHIARAQADSGTRIQSQINTQMLWFWEIWLKHGRSKKLFFISVKNAEIVFESTKILDYHINIHLCFSKSLCAILAIGSRMQLHPRKLASSVRCKSYWFFCMWDTNYET